MVKKRGLPQTSWCSLSPAGRAVLCHHRRQLCRGLAGAWW